MGVREDFIAAGEVAAKLLTDPAVAAAWDKPSALAEFSVAGLAGHLAFQVLAIPQILEAPHPAEPMVPVEEHYARVAWVDADLDADINVRIRTGGEEVAAEGPTALAAQLTSTLEQLRARLRSTANRPVRIAFWGPWSLALDDMLLTRTMELVVHADDLAVSAGIATPEFPASVTTAVIDLLTRLSVRRHGPAAVVRALTRAERAPATITAF
ncbi:maleylpyruvate isomerase N-terminal domain-containing protein [Kribbella sp. NPDC026611]|uniref:maleylpyruvate isomerase N-terminal domain-containing protein n=1 Tax=Kribbella sp. NPDC026611 TaxID=3154911 RepID=UPI0033F8169E